MTKRNKTVLISNTTSTASAWTVRCTAHPSRNRKRSWTSAQEPASGRSISQTNILARLLQEQTCHPSSRATYRRISNSTSTTSNSRGSLESQSSTSYTGDRCAAARPVGRSSTARRSTTSSLVVDWRCRSITLGCTVTTTRWRKRPGPRIGFRLCLT
jgi:hypothetical protein